MVVICLKNDVTALGRGDIVMRALSPHKKREDGSNVAQICMTSFLNNPKEKNTKLWLHIVLDCIELSFILQVVEFR
jgi:hypothetical protein